MKKVIIVDDEYLIREGLHNSVPWEKYGMEVVATAENGEEALFLAKECHPDVVVTDICMPFMDGIEMAEQLAQQWPDVVLVILTCLDEFEYARKAVKVGAFDYVLKPIDLPAFENLLGEIQKKIELRDQQQRTLGTVLSDVVHRRETAALLQDHLKNTGQEDGLTYCCVMFQLLGFRYAQSVFSPEELRAALTQASDILRVCSGENELLFEGQEDDGRYLIIIGNREKKVVQQSVDRVCRKVRQEMRIRDDYPMLCAISECVQGEALLLRAYQQCKEIIRTSYLYDNTQFIPYCDFDLQKETSNINGLIDAFCDAVRTFDSQTIQEELQKVSEALRSNGGNSLLYGYVFVATAFTNMMKIAKETGVDIEEFEAEFTKEFQHIICMDSLTSQIQKIGELVDKLCKIITLNQVSPHSSVIQRAKAYMNRNYTDSELSLQRVAYDAHISPSYFSILFKQSFGVSFIAYLTDLRMTRASELLCHTNQKVYEISYAVGYDNATYFSTLFKRRFGMGPNEYRQQFAKAPIETDVHQDF